MHVHKFFTARLLTIWSLFVRKKLPKLVLSAGDSSSDASSFEQQPLPIHLSLTQPAKSQSLPGARTEISLGLDL